MGSHAIHVQGARTHNLRDLDVEIPWEAWTTVTGVSGSGKSSLVLDTLGAESRRRFLGALGRSAAGQELLARPDVDRIEGLPPAVLVGAGERAPGPHETVGTITEVSHALRALWARAATAHCPVCGAPLPVTPRARVLERLLALPKGTKLQVLARVGRGPKALQAAQRAGYVRVSVAGAPATRLEDVDPSGLDATASVDVVLDRLIVDPDASGLGERLRDTLEQAFTLGQGLLRTHEESPGRPARQEAFAARPVCATCERSYPPLAARHLSPTQAEGACPGCRGLGEVAPEAPARSRTRAKSTQRTSAAAEPTTCPACAGTRLAPYGAAARLEGRTLPEVEALPIAEARDWLAPLGDRVPAVAHPSLVESLARLGALAALGLAHLPLGRAARTLARGELRRARLAAALSLGMGGLLYLLDEPMASCHVVERAPLRARLRSLVDAGSTVVSVEHDLDAVRAADHVLELGPGAGREGGRLVAQGTPASVAKGTTALARALARPPRPPRTAPRGDPGWITLEGLALRNLQDLAVRVPSPGLTCVTGVSGAGKSTLVFGCLERLAQRALDLVPPPPAACGRATGLGTLRHVSAAEARAARHPRASVVSLLGAFAPLRELYAATLEARARGWKETRFALGRPGGRCEACKGTGLLAAASAEAAETRGACEACGGRRYGAEVDAVRVKGLSIADLLELTLGEAAPMFRHVPRVGGPLAAAAEVGLGYLPLGRAASRLSTGEVLRLRLAAALGRGGTGPTLYLLDEPAAGLHPDDVAHLILVLERLVEAGHTVVAVEHDLELVRAADHVLDLGPGPGDAGGRLLYEGPPAGLVGRADSPTGRALATASSRR